MKLEEQVAEVYKGYEKNAAEDGFFTQRERAFAAFSRKGLPTLKDEEWKYTSLKPLLEKEFGRAGTSGEAAGFARQLPLGKIEAHRLTFVNGVFHPELSQTHPLAAGIVIQSLQQARKDHSDIVAKHFGRYVNAEEGGLPAMNASLLNDGVFLYVPTGVNVGLPVHIIHIAEAGGKNVMQHPRNLLILEENASATVVDCWYAIGAGASFTNVVSEIYVGPGASLEHCSIQQESAESYHTHFTQLFQEEASRVNHFTFTLDGTLVRNNLHFYHNGKNCESNLYGLYFGQESNHIDNHTRVDHAKPYCNSNELYKGIMSGSSTAVFNGKIVVHEDAQKTSAYQRNQNILLSEQSTVNTKPQLEIFADDVKCTHGATVGQISEESLFYLRSRGIPLQEAKKLLMNAFAADIAGKLKSPELTAIVADEIAQRL